MDVPLLSHCTWRHWWFWPRAAPLPPPPPPLHQSTPRRCRWHCSAWCSAPWAVVRRNTGLSWRGSCNDFLHFHRNICHFLLKCSLTWFWFGVTVRRPIIALDERNHSVSYHITKYWRAALSQLCTVFWANLSLHHAIRQLHTLPIYTWASCWSQKTLNCRKANNTLTHTTSNSRISLI